MHCAYYQLINSLASPNRIEDIMDIIYILIPLSILLIGIAVTVLFWAIKSGQFDDMDSPAHKILFDDDDNLPK